MEMKMANIGPHFKDRTFEEYQKMKKKCQSEKGEPRIHIEMQVFLTPVSIHTF